MTGDLDENVSEYDSETVQKTDGLEYSACCVNDYDTGLLERLTDDVLEKRYGCGSPLPDDLGGLTVLDLGSFDEPKQDRWTDDSSACC